MMRRIQHHPATLSAVPAAMAAPPAGVAIAARTVASLHARSANNAIGTMVSTRADSRACALWARCSSATAARMRNSPATRSSGAAAGPPNSAHVRSTLATIVTPGRPAASRVPGWLMRVSASGSGWPRCTATSTGVIVGCSDGSSRVACANAVQIECPLRMARAAYSHHAATSTSLGAPGRRFHANQRPPVVWRQTTRASAQSIGSDARRGSRSEHDDDDGSRRADAEHRRIRPAHRRCRVSAPTIAAVGHDRADPRCVAIVRVDDLDDLGDAPGTAWPALDVDDHVGATHEVLAHRRERPGGRRLHDQRLQAVHRVERTVRVTRRQRPVVAGVERLHQPHHLGAADLADHEPVGAETQRGVQQPFERDRGYAVAARRAGFETDEVPDTRVELGGVLERDDPLAGCGAAEQAAQQ